MVQNEIKETGVLNFFNDPLEAKEYFMWCRESQCPVGQTILEIIREKLGKNFRFEHGFLVDLACGSGASIACLSELGFAKFLGIDGAQTMLELLPQYLQKKNLKAETALMDLRDFNIPVSDSSVDMVSSCSSLIYIEKIDGIIKEASRVLKSGGLFGFNLIVHHQKDTNAYSFLDEDAVRMYVHSADLIQKIFLAAGFEYIAGTHELATPAYIDECASYESVVVLRKK